MPFVDVATGSLGQGLGCACGMAYSSKYLDALENRYWVVCGDGECAEGSVWEAANFASYYALDNLTLIVDVNRLGQSQATSLEHDVETYYKRFDAFGWNAIVIDGHDISQIINAFYQSRNSKKPTAIIAHTFKGKYFTELIENKLDWHGKPIALEAVYKNVTSLMKNKDVKLVPTGPKVKEWKDQE